MDAKDKLTDLGCCPVCLQVAEMDIEGPFSHCKCGTGEDYAKRPLQQFQMLTRASRSVITSLINNNNGQIDTDGSEWGNFVCWASECETDINETHSLMHAYQIDRELLFDGYAVYQAMDDKAQGRTSGQNVSDVLDALARLSK